MYSEVPIIKFVHVGGGGISCLMRSIAFWIMVTRDPPLNRQIENNEKLIFIKYIVFKLFENIPGKKLIIW